MDAKDKNGGFPKEERAALAERARELKAEAKASKNRAEGEKAVRENIAEMTEDERAMAEGLHALILESAPELMPKTWYGMPAYALDNKVVCFFRAASKFDARYATLAFTDTAKLDDGAMWPTAYALVELTPEVEVTIAALVKRAVGR